MLEGHGLLRFEDDESERVREGRDAVDGEALSDCQIQFEDPPEMGGFFVVGEETPQGFRTEQGLGKPRAAGDMLKHELQRG